MDYPKKQHCVLLCGDPSADKKSILDALAKHMNESMPTLIDSIDDMPKQVAWEALFPTVGRVSFKTFYGTGFMYERAIKAQLSHPASLIVYVLEQLHTDFLETSIGSDEMYFETHADLAKTFGRSWRDVPWLFVLGRIPRPDPFWSTELIPPELASSALIVDPATGAGIPELASTIDHILAESGRPR